MASTSLSQKTLLLRRHPVPVIFVLALLLALGSVRLMFTDGDEGRYLALGMAVAEGAGRTDLHLPTPRPDFLTPPLYPLVLGGLIRVFGENLVLLKASSVVFFLAALGVFASLIRKRGGLEPGERAAALALGCLNVFVLSMNWLLLAEMFFLLLLALAWHLAEDKAGSKRGFPLRPVLAGVLAGLAILVRPSGLALLPAGVLHYGSRRRWGAMAGFALAALLVNLPTMLHTMELAGTPIAYLTHYRVDPGAEAAGQSGGALANLLGNVFHMAPVYQFHFVPRHLFFSLMDGDNLLARLHLSFLAPVLSLSLGALVLAGMLLRGKRFGIMEWFYLGYLALISTYNQPDFAARGEYFYQDRYLHPLLPLAGFYLINALACGRRWLLGAGARGLGTLQGSLAAYVLLTSLAVSGLRLRTEWRFRSEPSISPARHLAIPLPEHQAYGRYLEACQWAAESLEPDALLISRKPRHTWIVSRRQSFRPTELNEGRDTWTAWTSFLPTRPVYILQDGYNRETGYGRDGRVTVDPLIAAQQDKLRLVHETAEPVTRVWRILSP